MAVYTHVADEELAHFLRDYDLGEARRLVGIAEGVENSNFILETTTGRYILTLFEKAGGDDRFAIFPWVNGPPCQARDGMSRANSAQGWTNLGEIMRQIRGDYWVFGGGMAKTGCAMALPQGGEGTGAVASQRHGFYDAAGKCAWDYGMAAVI